ncbi:hypothetical protein BKA70DRAFT_1522319 [Coprinopsis sp. MPI-PUGE-AT-0042]|nr:hypothetical protein BKA70DRAFT_1522319 [Coprinopsis sp. MPI-PUGE-AT-0042]
MFFSRALFSFFAVGAISALAAPGPALVEKREDISDVLATLDTLEASNDAIIPQIDALIDGNTANEANLSPLLEALVFNVDTTTATFKSYEGRTDPHHGGSKDDVAKKVAKIIEKIIIVIHKIKTHKPHLYFLVIKYGLELALYKLLLGLEIIVAGVLVLVGALLKVVLGLLGGLGRLLFALLFGWHY